MKNSNKNSKKSRMAVESTATRKKYKQSIKNSNFSEDSNSKNIRNKIIIFILVLIVAIIFVLVSGVFNINEIIVENNDKVSIEEAINYSGINIGDNIFSVSKNIVKNKLKENSFIDDAKVKKVFPNKIKLILDERHVDYALQLANSYVYINKQGYVLKISTEIPTVPIILGFTTDLSNIKENDRLDNKDLEKMNIVIKIMETAENNKIGNLISRIDISNEENYTIYLDEKSKIAYLGNGVDLNTRFLYILAILREQEGKSGEIFVNMDLNTEYAYFRENI